MNWGASGIETAIWILALAVWSVMIGVNVWSHKKTKSDIRWFGVNQTFYRIFTNNIWVRESDTSAVRTRDPAATARLVRLILKKRRLLKDILFLSGLFLMAMAFGRPQWGSHQEPVFQRGIDIVLLLDTSESMKAEDMAPNRLAKAQSIIDSLLDRLPGSRVD